MDLNNQNKQKTTVGSSLSAQHRCPCGNTPVGSTSDQGNGASVCSQRRDATVSASNRLVNGVWSIFQHAWGVVSSESTYPEVDTQKNEEVDELLDAFSLHDLQNSIVAECFSQSELQDLAKNQPMAELDLDGSFVLVDVDLDERRDLRAELGLSDPVQHKKDKEEERSIMLQQSFVPHRGRNFGVAPRPLSVKVPPSNVVDTNSIGKPYERIPGPEHTTEDTNSQVLRVRVAEQGSLQGGRVTTLLTVKT